MRDLPAISSEDLALIEADEALPELLGFYRDVAGLGAAMKLAQEYGGTELYLPLIENLKDSHHLIVSLGREAAEILCRDFGPAAINVPMGPSLPPSKAKMIRKLLTETGLTARQIAQRVRTTERNVWRIKAEYRAEIKAAQKSNNLSLF